MKISQVAGEVEARTGIKTSFLILLATSMACTLLMLIALLVGGRTHRETIIPPVVNKTFWVEGSAASPEYLEMMSKFVIDLALTNTPPSCNYNSKLLLQFVGSGSYGNIQKQLAENCKALIDNGASTLYVIREFNFAKGRDNEAVVSGQYTRWIAEKKVYEAGQSYYLKFGYSGGRMYIYELSQIVDNNTPVSVLDPTVNAITKSLATTTVQVQKGDGIAPPPGGNGISNQGGLGATVTNKPQ